MADNMNLNELLEGAKQCGIELTEEQLDAIAGGESIDYEALGTLAYGAWSLGAALAAMKEAKDSGMTVEEFIVSNGSEPTPEMVQAIAFLWNYC